MEHNLYNITLTCIVEHNGNGHWYCVCASIIVIEVCGSTRMYCGTQNMRLVYSRSVGYSMCVLT